MRKAEVDGEGIGCDGVGGDVGAGRQGVGGGTHRRYQPVDDLPMVEDGKARDPWQHGRLDPFARVEEGNNGSMTRGELIPST